VGHPAQVEVPVPNSKKDIEFTRLRLQLAIVKLFRRMKRTTGEGVPTPALQFPASW
jgi:hypothetical protein